jgi:DNA-binding NarL/FixJ family response regulator
VTPIRVLLVEDQTLLRHGLRTILDLEDGFAVVAEAADGAAAVEQALATRPDVVLMDIHLPRLDGIAATERIGAALPDAKIVLLTTFDRDDFLHDGIAAGARGFLLKEIPATELLAAIRRVHAGGLAIQPELLPRLAAEIARRGGGAAPAVEPLTERERDVLRLLAAGLGNKEIAGSLGITEGTVKNHVSVVLAKLGAANRTQAALLARERGLG